MVRTAANPGGLPKEVFDGFQAQVASNRSQLYRDVAWISPPTYWRFCRENDAIEALKS